MEQKEEECKNEGEVNSMTELLIEEAASAEGDTVGRKQKWLKYSLFAAAILPVLVIAVIIITVTISNNNYVAKNGKDHGAASNQNMTIDTGEKNYTRTQNRKLNVNSTHVEQGKNKNKTNEINKRKLIIETASRISSQMNFNADPCEDFHEFVCGNFTREFILPENMLEYNSLIAEEEHIYLQGKAIMEEVDEADWAVVKKAKQYYRSCMDKNRLEKLGLKPMKDKLRKVGGWPVIEGDQWDSDDYIWQEQVYKMGRNGFSTDFIVSLAIGNDLLDSTTRTLLLDFPTFGLAYKYLNKGWSNAKVQEYYTYMKSTAILFGADPNTAPSEMEEALLFELALAKIDPFYLYSYSLNGENDDAKQYWNNYVKNLLIITNSSTLKPIQMSPYFKVFGARSISTLLEKTDSRVIANYLGWRMTESALNRLNSNARKIKQSFINKINGNEIDVPRWKECLKEAGFNSYTDNNFRIPLSSVYVKKHVGRGIKEEITHLKKYIQENFKQELLRTSWLDNNTKMAAVKKLTNMDHFIAYPDELLDQTTVENHFDGLDISEADYLGNYNRLNVWERNFKFGKLNKKVEKKDSWMDHSWVVVVNAFNNLRQNAVEFSAGLIHGAFYDKELPKYLTFGTVGTMIGHEMVHGFDNKGRYFDFEGNFKEWWSYSANNTFSNRTKCLVDQYSNFFSDQVYEHLDGENTLSDNIADNGGLNQAYLAYDQWVKSNGEEESSLPGLEHFTPRQLFFISYGQNWCAKYSDAKLKEVIELDVHSPMNFRITGPISNSPHFPEIFGCKKGSGMNPVKKCHLW